MTSPLRAIFDEERKTKSTPATPTFASPPAFDYNDPCFEETLKMDLNTPLQNQPAPSMTSPPRSVALLRNTPDELDLMENGKSPEIKTEMNVPEFEDMSPPELQGLSSATKRLLRMGTEAFNAEETARFEQIPESTDSFTEQYDQIEQRTATMESAVKSPYRGPHEAVTADFTQLGAAESKWEARARDMAEEAARRRNLAMSAKGSEKRSRRLAKPESGIAAAPSRSATRPRAEARTQGSVRKAAPARTVAVRKSQTRTTTPKQRVPRAQSTSAAPEQPIVVGIRVMLARLAAKYEVKELPEGFCEQIKIAASGLTGRWKVADKTVNVQCKGRNILVRTGGGWVPFILFAKEALERCHPAIINGDYIESSADENSGTASPADSSMFSEASLSPSPVEARSHGGLSRLSLPVRRRGGIGLMAARKSYGGRGMRDHFSEDEEDDEEDELSSVDREENEAELLMAASMAPPPPSSVEDILQPRVKKEVHVAPLTPVNVQELSHLQTVFGDCAALLDEMRRRETFEKSSALKIDIPTNTENLAQGKASRGVMEDDDDEEQSKEFSLDSFPRSFRDGTWAEQLLSVWNAAQSGEVSINSLQSQLPSLSEEKIDILMYLLESRGHVKAVGPYGNVGVVSHVNTTEKVRANISHWIPAL